MKQNAGDTENNDFLSPERRYFVFEKKRHDLAPAAEMADCGARGLIYRRWLDTACKIRSPHRGAYIIAAQPHTLRFLGF